MMQQIPKFLFSSSKKHVATATTNHRGRTKHTLAITREIPNSFVHALSAHHDAETSDDSVCLATCKSQHSIYLQTLRKHIPITYSLPPLEEYPDCTFVEDTVVTIGGHDGNNTIACLMQPGHKSRRGEVDSIKDFLERFGFVEGETLFDMRRRSSFVSEKSNITGDGDIDDEDEDENSNNLSLPLADGGDILYTGRHLFVGISHRTNLLGYQFLHNAFSSSTHGNALLQGENIIAVPPVVQGNTVLHLKSAVTHLDETTLLIPEGSVGDAVLQAMGAKERGYKHIIRLPNILSCNAVVVNGAHGPHVLAQDSKDCEVSKERIALACQERGIGWTFVDTSELAKKDAALTCCSVLFSL